MVTQTEFNIRQLFWVFTDGSHRSYFVREVPQNLSRCISPWQPLAASGDAAPRHILSEVGREARPHWDYSCESWNRIDFSVTSFMLMVADNEDFSYECLKLFHWEVTEGKSADKWKGDKNL